jgi:hypothetical protein
VLTEAGKNYDFALGGNTATSFNVVSDGSGGTLIAPTTSAQMTFIQAMAGMTSSGATMQSVATTSASAPTTLASPVTYAR